MDQRMDQWTKRTTLRCGGGACVGRNEFIVIGRGVGGGPRARVTRHREAPLAGLAGRRSAVTSAVYGVLTPTGALYGH